MSTFLLDTNIVSEGVRPHPQPRVATWIQRTDRRGLFISAMSIAEIRRGVLTAPIGARRRRLEEWAAGRDGPASFFAGRILSFDADAALHWARFMAEGISAGQPRSPIDMIIAATAATHGCILVTINARHFHGIVPVLNPLDEAASSG